MWIGSGVFLMANINETVSRNYRMDKVSLAYLEAMQNKLTVESRKKVTHTDLIKQALSYYANHVLSNDEMRNIQMEILFGNFDK